MKKFSILVAASLMAASLSAQDIVVKSHIQSTDGQPVKGAIVSIVGEKTTGISDADGAFTLNTNTRNALVTIKAEGYYSRELPLSLFTKNGGLQGITLVPETEKYVSGSTDAYYGSVARGMQTGTSLSVEAKDFNEKQTIGSATRDLLTGLEVVEKSGMPGEGAYLNLRGVHSFVADNAPLIVINGVPHMSSNDVSGVINGYSRDMLFGFDPKDIRRVSVLKGADAAMYGSLGSNGVIVIETQQATSDNLDTRMSFSGSYGFNIAHGQLPTLSSSQYKDYMKDLGLTLYPSMDALRKDYPFLQNGDYAQAYLFNENTDWYKDISQSGFTTENIFRVEGGDEIAKYNISFGYTGNQGTISSTSQDKYHTLISADVLASRKVDIFTNVGLSYVTSNLQNTGMVAQTNPITAAYLSMPLIHANKKQTDGSVLSNLANYSFWNTSSNPLYAYDNVSNPIGITSGVEAKDKIYDVNTQVGINYRWNNYLTLTGMVNLYYNYTEETLFVPGVTSGTILPQIYGDGLNKVGNGVITQSVNTYSVQGAYNRIFNKVHAMNIFASARAITRDIETDISEGYNTASDDYKTLDNTTDAKQTFGTNTEWNYMGFNLHGDYTYNQQWRATVSMALDGTSASGADATRWGFFPSVGVTYMLANTGVLPSFIDRFNIFAEGSYSGNSRFSSNYGKNYYTGSNFFNIGSITRSNVPNTKLEWEKKRQLDFGIDLGMWGDRVALGVNYFTSHAYDLLLNSDVSAVYGSADYYDNLGEINSHGIEATLRVAPVRTKDWNVTLAANIATVKSTIESLGGAEQMIINYTGYNNDDAQIVMRKGGSPYEFYGYQTRGIFSTAAEAQQANLRNAGGTAYGAGDVWFVDQNGDGVIDEGDKVALGSNRPDVYGGVNLAVSYKRFTLDANFAYSLGAKMYNATRRQLEEMSTFHNQSTAVMNRWQVEGQQATLPRAVYGDPQGNNAFSDRWIEDGDYFKLRSLRLSYSFDKLLGFIRSGNVYVTGENLFSITKYLGSDPEYAYSYDEAMRGFDYAKTTLPITVRLGFNINF